MIISVFKTDVKQSTVMLLCEVKETTESKAWKYVKLKQTRFFM